MFIQKSHNIKLTKDMLSDLGVHLGVYRRDFLIEPSNESELYQDYIAGQLEDRFWRKTQSMSRSGQKECRFRFYLAEIVLLRSILIERVEDRQGRGLLRLFDQAKINLLPLHPT